MDYLDFEITIAATPTGDYRLTATCDGEETSADFNLPLDETLLENHLLRVQSSVLVRSAQVRLSLSEAERTIQSLGRTLFDALFTTPVRDLFRASRRRATHEGKRGVRLKLDIQSPLLAALPWEYLYHPGDQEYIGLSLNSPIIRTYPVPTAAPLQLPRPLRILGMIANPYDLSNLDVAGEKTRLESALAPLGNQVQLEWVATGTLPALQNALEEDDWHIFHYIGHGGFDQRRDEGFLALEDERGKSKPAYTTQLFRLFQRGQGLQLAVLNSCDSARHSRHDLISAPAMALVRRGLPAVLAMQFAIPDSVAKALTSHLYRALAKGRPLDYALADARQSLTLDDIDALEWGVPVLYMRSTRPTVAPPQGTPRLPTATSSPTDGNATLWQELVQAEKAEEWDTVISVGEILLKRGYRGDETRTKVAKGYHERFEIAFDNQQFDQAIKDESRAIELIPTDAFYHYQRGAGYHEAAVRNHPAGDFAKAIEDKSHAIQLDPNNARYYEQRGVSYHEAATRNHPIGDFAKAIEDKSRAIQLDANNASYHYSRGLSYHAAASRNHPTGDFAKAIEDHFRAIQLDPNNSEYYEQRGVGYHAAANKKHWIGDYAKAISDYNRAIELNPQFGRAYFGRGNAYQTTGKRAEAERDHAKAKALGYNG